MYILYLNDLNDFYFNILLYTLSYDFPIINLLSMNYIMNLNLFIYIFYFIILYFIILYFILFIHFNLRVFFFNIFFKLYLLLLNEK